MRRSLSTNVLYKEKLKLLANSCDFPYLKLGAMIVSLFLDSPKFVHMIQHYHNTVRHYWVTAEVTTDRRVVYHLDTVSTEIRNTTRFKSRYAAFQRPIQLKFSFDNDHDRKLSLLSRSCNVKKSELAAIILHYALDNSEFILQLQKRYNVHEHYWVIPMEEEGGISYVLSS